ncbi:MAG: VCBS repeat-containing protein, partial [Candidatus Peregrinibacteria bacterium]
MLGNQLAYLNLPGFVVPKAHAQADSISSEDHDKLGLIAILADNALLSGSLKNRIFTFAQNVQDRMPHSLAFVIGIDSNESPFRIASTLEKLYLEGYDTDLLDRSGFNDNETREDDNRLIGAIFIGDIPMPVVTEADGSTQPSLYPYTDFYQKRYIYNHETERYEPNNKAKSPQPDIWHGVIAPPGGNTTQGRQELEEFFDKNAQYSMGNPEYSQFTERLLYSNYPAVERKLNKNDYFNYRHLITYLEEMAFQRYNKHLLKDLADRVAEEMGAEVMPNEFIHELTDKNEDDMINEMPDFATETFFETYTTPLAKAMRTYLGKLNALIEETGRYDSSEYDSLESLISTRDKYMENTLLAKSIQLENKVNEAIEEVQAPKTLIHSLYIKVRACSDSSCSDVKSEMIFDNDEKTAHENQEGNENYKWGFLSFIDGFPANPRNPVEYLEGKFISSAEQCGMERGQKRPPGVPVLENNSVLVEANRTFNLDTALPEDKKDTSETLLKDRIAYINSAGCVGNNAYSVHKEFTYEEETYKIDLDPKYCRPENSINPIFDILGSKENNFEFYDPSVPRPDTIFEPVADRCDLQNMSFLPAILPEEGLYSDDTIFHEEAYDPGDLTSGTDLDEVLLEIYSRMITTGELEPATIDLLNPDPDDVELNINISTDIGVPHLWLKRIARVLLKDSLSATRSYTDEGGNYIEFTIRGNTKEIPSIARHIEPTDEHIREIQNGQVTPGTPADGIRYVEFDRDGSHHIFQYFNLFRVPGNNPDQVADNLITLIREKDDELNEKLGRDANVINRFFQENLDLLEPIVWRNLGVDQKYAMVAHKFMDRDSGMPVVSPAPGSAQSYPVAKPNGYEIWHLNALGDETGFNFGINAAMQKQGKPAGRGEEEEEGDHDQTAPPTTTDEAAEGEGAYLCGDPNGVEIWEWLDAIQCWLENEILPAHELFTMDNSCSSGDLPEDEELNEEAVLSFDPLAIHRPAQLNVRMNSYTVMERESVEITIRPIDENGDEMVEFMPDPAILELSEKNVGTLSAEEAPLTLGKARVTFTGEELGTTTLNVSLGELSAIPIDIRVVNKIDVQLTASPYDQEEGRGFYNITATLVDENGDRINNINSEIKLITQEPLAGAFNRNGKINLLGGQGETVFFPAPNQAEIKITAQHPHYSSQTLALTPPPNPPHHINVKADRFFKVGEVLSLPVTVVDINDLTSVGFNDSLFVELSESSREFAELASPELVIENGRGILSLRIKNQTGYLNLTLTHPDLASGKLEKPILARVESEDIAETYPQNLFASMVGFPGANFLHPNYFAGRHLFSGKTEAVFGLLNGPRPPDVARIAPNYKIELLGTKQDVRTFSSPEGLTFYIVDEKNLETLASTTVPLDFSDILTWNPDEPAQKNTLYLNVTNAEVTAQPIDLGFELRDSENRLVATFTPNEIDIADFDYTLDYNTDTDFEGIELKLKRGPLTIAQLFFSLTSRTLSPADFTVHKDLVTNPIYSGISTKNPTGLAFYNPLGAIPENPYGDNFGFEGDNKYLVHIAGGTPVGEAVRFELPVNGVLLGDPTIQLSSSPTGALNYDSTVGQKIFQDPNGVGIAALTHFNFNGDEYPDIATVMQDGRVRLLEGGPTTSGFRDRGDIAFLGDGAITIVPFNMDNDGYEDLVISTQEGRLAILHNTQGVITRTDHNLNVGKQLYTLLKEDMDRDGFDDLITLDSRGDIRIFYSENGQLPEEGMLVGNYGFTISEEDLSGDLQIRYPGLVEPVSSADPASPLAPRAAAPRVRTPSAAQNNALRDFMAIDDPDEAKSGLNMDRLAEQILAIAKNAKDAVEAEEVSTTIAESTIPKLPWPEGEEPESYFASIADAAFLNVTKTVYNKERMEARDLDLEETLVYVIHLNPRANMNNVVIADTVPDALLTDIRSVTCRGIGCESLNPKQNDVLLFFHPLNLRSGQEITISYEATVKHTPKANLFLKYLQDPDIVDPYPDVIVSPPYNTSG